MQCFKLVNGGFVDKVIVFDSLPEHLFKNIKTRGPEGFPRSWAKWLIDIGSCRTVYETSTTMDAGRNYTFHKKPIGKEPCFYVLDYTDTNADKESWRMICDYLRANVLPGVRLTEKIIDMAIALAPDPYKAMTVEPEDVPVVSVPSGAETPEPSFVKAGEVVLVQEVAPKKKPGRPKKVAVEV